MVSPFMLHYVTVNRTARRAHLIPLRRFIEAVFGTDLRHFSAEKCFKVYCMRIDCEISFNCFVYIVCTEIWRKCTSALQAIAVDIVR